MARRFRSTQRCFLIALSFAVAGLVSGCTNAAMDKAIGSGAGAGIAVAKTATTIAVTNNTGRPALDVRVNVELADGGLPFFHLLPTMDPGQKIDLAFTDFRNEEGMLLDPQAVTPKQIKTTARDTLANRYDTTIPW